MTIPTSRRAYEDCYTTLDTALASPEGIRVGFDLRSQAMTAVTRLNRARQLTREQNAAVYPADDPKHGVCDYDTLLIRQPREKEGRWYVYIEPRRAIGVIEQLGAAE